MEGPAELPREYCVYGYWHIHEGHPYVMKNNKIETHVYTSLDEAIDFIKEHSQWNVNITWCLTWDTYEIRKLTSM